MRFRAQGLGFKALLMVTIGFWVWGPLGVDVDPRSCTSLAETDGSGSGRSHRETSNQYCGTRTSTPVLVY